MKISENTRANIQALVLCALVILAAILLVG